MHVTIQRGTSVPELQKCNTCCRMYHCPFCQPAWFKPTYYCKVKDHVEGHFNRAVSHEGYTIHRCGLQCRPKLHFHCIYCCGIIMRRVPFINHLRICKEKHPALMVSAAAAKAPASPRPTAVSPFAAPPTAAHPSASPPSAGPSIAGPFTTGPSTATPPADAPPSVLPDVAASFIAPSVAPLSTAPLATAPCAAASSVLPASAPHSASPPTVPIPQGGRMKKIRHQQITQKCPICHIMFNKKNIKTHIERKHTKRQKDVTAMHHLENECIDPVNGIYAVSKSHCGTCIPLHVQLKIWGENQHVSCESSDCQTNMDFALRSGLSSHQCVHLRSIVYCSAKEKQLVDLIVQSGEAEQHIVPLPAYVYHCLKLPPPSLQLDTIEVTERKAMKCTEETVSMAQVRELLEQQKDFDATLLAQQKKHFKLCVEVLADSANKKVWELMGQVHDLRSIFNKSMSIYLHGTKDQIGKSGTCFISVDVWVVDGAPRGQSCTRHQFKLGPPLRTCTADKAMHSSKQS
ncbi:uncharacterized protein LOC109516704 [Hippocampus comes]|uniref:uncharacterized protein LOC109516704 n=1 Tax=Hippocampus comes TaxID=109280 RepID=UPI00094EC873|nr:PREDICTED: uncharacterized protein LOC109516704 [Hippocampus comes]